MEGTMEGAPYDERRGRGEGQGGGSADNADWLVVGSQGWGEHADSIRMQMLARNRLSALVVG